MPDITPGGFTQKCWDAYNRHIEAKGFARVGFADTKYGTVYMAERFDPAEGWIVVWGARDMMCDITCSLESTAEKRRQAALNHAFSNLQGRETVFKELG